MTSCIDLQALSILRSTWIENDRACIISYVHLVDQYQININTLKKPEAFSSTPTKLEIGQQLKAVEMYIVVDRTGGIAEMVE